MITSIAGLHIYYQNISDLKADSFSSFPNLISIGFGYNIIKKIDKNAFKDLNDLTGLHLNRNNISTIEDGALDILVPFRRLEAKHAKVERYNCKTLQLLF